MKKTLSVAIAIITLSGIAAWGVYLYSPHQQGGIVERSGLYYVGTKMLGAGYIRENGRVLYVERIQYYAGTSAPNGVRYNKFAVAGANPATFSLMTETASANSEEIYYEFGKDDKNIFYQGLLARPSTGSTHPIDTSTFTVIQNNYIIIGKDRNAVYEIYPNTYTELAGIDPATFTLIGDTCAKDKNSFYTIGYYGEFTATTTALTHAQCVHPGPGL